MTIKVLASRNGESMRESSKKAVSMYRLIVETKFYSYFENEFIKSYYTDVNRVPFFKGEIELN
jgi:hypothetical protein